jgi:ribosomal protein S18 acetylase RimI-like enzyme
MPRLRRIAGAVLGRLQSLALYRKIGRRLATRIVVREATDTDKLAVRHWLNRQGEPTQPQKSDSNVTEWVAYRHRRLAGFVQLMRYPPEHNPYAGHWLISLVVKSLHRGSGLGERLSHCVIARALEECAPTLNLLVKDDNMHAIRLYRKLGFETCIIPELEPHLEREREASGRRRVVMRKQLTNPQ